MKTKAVIVIKDNIKLNTLLSKSIRELCGQTLKVVLSDNGSVTLGNNPSFSKYCLVYEPSIIIFGAREYDIVLKKPIGGK